MEKKSTNLITITFVFIIAMGMLFPVYGQEINPELLKNRWSAAWIAVPDEPAEDYGVYHFRKDIELQAKPSAFVVHVSADNRYKLFVNGDLVSLGPARGDLNFWNFETVDLAPFLVAGSNTIAAVVWNEGNMRPQAQMTYRTGFLLQGNTDAESILNTDASWKCIRNPAYQPIRQRVPGYYVAGPGELVNMAEYIDAGWMQKGFDDSGWKNAVTVGGGWGGGGAAPRAAGATQWPLVPSIIPPMELTEERLSTVREADGVNTPAGFPENKKPFTVPANTRASISLDQSYLTNAYLTMIFSNGRNAEISVRYAEALYIPAPQNDAAQEGSRRFFRTSGKGNRNEVEGKIFIGRQDSIISSGASMQTFTTLDWRTYRYVKLEITTKEEPLTIEDIYGTFIGYPFEMKAKFEAGNPALQKILDIGWRSARLCAVEIYMDCPFYERLQYIGDGRIQMLLSLYNTGDDRLVRNAINLMDHSRTVDGITLSRHPSFTPQNIPFFSLWYIGALYDYWMYGSDAEFVADKLWGAREILKFFSEHQQSDGSLKGVPYWLYTDWAEGWRMGIPPIGEDGASAALDLQLLWAYQIAAEMENNIGMKGFAEIYAKKAAQLQKTIQAKYWDSGRGLYADRTEKGAFSQHANTLAILTGTIKGKAATTLAEKMLADTTLTSASIYFKYYLHQALVEAGLGDGYLDWLYEWHESIAMGLTTWPETSNINGARSDCHAWGASPNIEFYRIVLGIDSDAPGFKKVKIEPHLGDLKQASGEIPHPKGKVAVSYRQEGAMWNIEINLPDEIAGTLYWNDKNYSIKGGLNNFKL